MGRISTGCNLRKTFGQWDRKALSRLPEDMNANTINEKPRHQRTSKKDPNMDCVPLQLMPKLLLFRLNETQKP